MSRLRQTNEQKSGKQNSGKSLSDYYGGTSKKTKKSKKKGNPHGGY